MTDAMPLSKTDANSVKYKIEKESSDVFLHPGGGKEWNCPQCETMTFPTPCLFRKHLLLRHQIKEEDCTFLCSKCNEYSKKSAMAVASHMRYCGIKENPIRGNFKCGNCKRTFLTLLGKQVHRSRMHRAAYNEELPEKTVFAYSENELIYIVREVQSLGDQGYSNSDINKKIAEVLTGRTQESIRKIRREQSYFDMEMIVAMCEEDEKNAMQNESAKENLTSNQDDEQPEPSDGQVHARLHLNQWVESCNIATLSVKERLVLSYVNGEKEWGDIKSLLFPDAKRNNKAKTLPKEKSTPTKGKRENRASRKKAKFGLTQKLWQTKRKDTIRKIINGEFQEDGGASKGPKLADVEKAFRERLETVNVDSTPEIDIDEANEDPVLFGFITPANVKESISTFKHDTASSSDNVTLGMVLALSNLELSLILNVWRVRGIPASEKANLSILLHKSGDKTDVSNYRPLTIGSILMRLYAKIWDRRLRSVIKFNERQKAFVPLDGCFQNVHVIQSVIKRHRRAGTELNVVFLDLAKAFDTVTHTSIRKALNRRKIPSEVVDAILNMYLDASTTFVTSEGMTEEIKILSGVKQGCPLSPLLFNVVLDELLERLEETKCGVLVEEEIVGATAFADDIALLSKDRGDMEILMKVCLDFFNEKALTVNAKKCASMRLLPVKGKRSMKVVTGEHRWWNDQAIPSIDHDNLVKYLGIRLTPLGDVILPFDEWNNWFKNLKKSALKAEQKVVAIRSSICPMIFYVLRMSNARITHLRKVDVMLRRWYRLIVHGPPWMSNSWIHHDAGGRIPNMVESVVKARMKAIGKMIVAEDRVAAVVGLELETRAQDDLEVINFHGPLSLMKRTMESRREERLKTEPNGSAITTMLASHMKRWWLLYGTNLRTGDRIHCIHFLSGTLPTLVNQHRGVGDKGVKLCRRCHSSAETDLHVLSECDKNKGLIVARHDGVVNKIVKEVRKRHPGQTFRERSWVVGQKQSRPDFTLFTGDSVFFVDITCPYEKDASTLAKREEEKELKYSRLLNKNSLPLDNINQYRYIGLAFGACGTIDKRTVNKLHGLGYPVNKVHHLQMAVMSGSARICATHFQGDKKDGKK